MSHRTVFFSLLLAALFSGPAFSEDKVPVGKEDPKFLRFKESPNEAVLETASVKYSHPDGTTVELIGAVHIADKPYYSALNTQFKQYDALLYEMVGGDPENPPSKEQLQSSKNNLMRTLQSSFGKMMKLDFQLDHIDYTAKNFVHADMSFETFQKRQKAKGENLFSLMLKAQKQAPSNKSQNLNLSAILKLLLNNDPTEMKIELGRQFQDVESIIAGIEGPDGSVLVAERNITALKVMERERKNGKKNMGIFYGAAHLPDFDKRLREELGFKRGKAIWHPAWTIKKTSSQNKKQGTAADKKKAA
ncbi:MAG: hypothetical protein MK183_04085 [Verrucomicrobiales bacterium]|nr:hypothetical protein [Verrucomicrobiales bacterium]